MHGDTQDDIRENDWQLACELKTAHGQHSVLGHSAWMYLSHKLCPAGPGRPPATRCPRKYNTHGNCRNPAFWHARGGFWMTADAFIITFSFQVLKQIHTISTHKPLNLINLMHEVLPPNHSDLLSPECRTFVGLPWRCLCSCLETCSSSRTAKVCIQGCK